ncbi:unnamed protein product [Sphenostylis stenocarpa]|uniref:Uncharacterized protein n=1 Tax=Sphenostylis stenocarpa TaxID=92480 RepID=A0AA86SZR0_9FABA|nr:unnamed protein product [Sphenostylis stenocarpa]
MLMQRWYWKKEEGRGRWISESVVHVEWREAERVGGGDIKGEEKKRGRVGYSWVQGVVTLVAGEPKLAVSIAVVTLSPALHFTGLHPL